MYLDVRAQSLPQLTKLGRSVEKFIRDEGTQSKAQKNNIYTYIQIGKGDGREERKREKKEMSFGTNQ